MNDAAVAAPEQGPLYRSEQKIYPREVRGRYATLRRIAMFVLLGIFYGGPWLTWNGRQAVLFDLPARKFYIFGLTLWPQDFIFLALLLVIAAISLFFFTALAGRLWCGYACPQTVWTEAFTWIERLIEGDRPQRMKLDRAPWTLPKVARKTAKQACWIALALYTGYTLVGYFSPIRELSSSLVTLGAGPWEWFWTLFYGFATWGNAGYMREQVCKYMCPYARFQSSMFDRDTLIITYDAERGEPRGSRRRGVDPRALGLGDCIDCTLCVQACPTGIDIRKGLQYECIACAACIDACNQVMDRMGYPRGLIRYGTERSLSHEKYRLFRPRTVIYGTILIVLVTVFGVSLATMQPVILDVIRDRNALYRDVGRQGIQNTYTVRVVNKHSVPHEYRLSVTGIEGIALQPEATFRVEPESVYTLPVSVTVPHEHAGGGHEVIFHLEATDGSNIRASEESRFRGPVEEPW